MQGDLVIPPDLFNGTVMTLVVCPACPGLGHQNETAADDDD